MQLQQGISYHVTWLVVDDKEKNPTTAPILCVVIVIDIDY